MNPFKIAVASGKGGTGKTTVSLMLMLYLKKILNPSVHIVDCDVEEPNDRLFYKELNTIHQEEVNQLIPFIDTNRCTFCGLCSEYCEFNAISIIKSVQHAEVRNDLCHSCGACSVACKFDAIIEKPEAIGTVSSYRLPCDGILWEGRLKVGSSMQTMLIGDLKSKVSNNTDFIIYDAPPGTSCSVVETISDCDFVVLVTEPTPFGFYDLKLMIQLVEDLKIPFGVVINKAGIGDGEVYHYLEKKGIPILTEIPFDKIYASNYAEGALHENIPEKIDERYRVLVDNLKILKRKYA